MSREAWAVALDIATAARWFAGREAVSVHVCSRGPFGSLRACDGHAIGGVSTAEKAYQDPGDDVRVPVVWGGCCWWRRFK